MWFAYIDESKDSSKLQIYTALVIDGEKWSASFHKVKDFRKLLRDKYGIFLSQELHAWKFAAGKGQISSRRISKEERAMIFREVIQFIAASGIFTVVSSCNKVEQFAFERMMNRINRTASKYKQNVLLFFDQGAEVEITKRIRKLRVYNPIPSKKGVWVDTGAPTKNLPLSNIVEDPIFKDSESSYFIQLADFCAYALLRSECPIESRSVLGYNTMYEELRPICRPFLNSSDYRKLGIIR